MRDFFHAGQLESRWPSESFTQISFFFEELPYYPPTSPQCRFARMSSTRGPKQHERLWWEDAQRKTSAKQNEMGEGKPELATAAQQSSNEILGDCLSPGLENSTKE